MHEFYQLFDANIIKCHQMDPVVSLHVIDLMWGTLCECNSLCSYIIKYICWKEIFCTQHKNYMYFLSRKKCKQLQLYTSLFSLRKNQQTLDWDLCSDSWLSSHSGTTTWSITTWNITISSHPLLGKQDDHYQILPYCMASFNCLLAARIQYTFSVSALSSDRESQDNPQCNYSTLRLNITLHAEVNVVATPVLSQWLDLCIERVARLE